MKEVWKKIQPIIVDSALGLPIEKLWDIKHLRQSSIRLAEISTLAIKKGYRAQRGKLLLPLCDFMQRYCRQYLGVDKIVATFHPEIRDFYRCVLLFHDIADGEVKTYEFVQGAAAVAGWLSLRDLGENYKHVYGEKKSNRNLYHFFLSPDSPQYLFDTKKFPSCSSFCFTPSLLEYFFLHKSDAFAGLTPEEKIIITNSYFYPEYFEIIFSSPKDKSVIDRKQARFSVYYKASWHLKEHLESSVQIYESQILEISKEGLKVFTPHLPPLKIGQALLVFIELPDWQKISVECEVVWADLNLSQIGLAMKGFAPKLWIEMIDELEGELAQLIHKATEITRKRLS